ncbi:MAG: tetratricopeptide repeat protein [Saprospirales bacterium]|nr:tetratricopeptide repeat protein [Saprospirales bacterium]MBK8489500.1 tetratricopeptide repeat protein [Saprospirales bacterium]
MLPKRLIVFMLAFLAFSSLIAQKAYVDSLRTAFQLEKDPVKKIDLLYSIAFEVSYGNPDLELAYADSIEAMVKEVGYKKGEAMMYYLRGHANQDLGKFEEALADFREELRIYRAIKEGEKESTALGDIAQVWDNLGALDSAVIYYNAAIDIDEKYGDLIGASIDLNNIGNIYSRQGALDKAIEHFEKALKVRQQLGAEKRYVQCYSNLAVVYGRKKDFEKATEYAKIGLDYALKYDNIAYAGIITNSLGSDLNEAGRPVEAIPWLEQALKHFEALGNKNYQTYAIYNLSRAYTLMGQPGRGLEFAERGFAIAREMNFHDPYELYYKAFAEAYEGLGNYRQAYNWYRKYVTLADSVLKSDNTQQMADIEARYETQKKETQLAKKDLLLERQSTQKKAILFGSIALLLILAGAFQYFRTRQKTRQREAELTAQLEHAEAEKLRELNQVKSAFFANISHEFRTPLTLINSPLEQLIEGTLKGDVQKYYRIMLRNGKRLLELVNQLLDLSRLESGKLQLQASESDLGQFVSAITGSFESLAVRRQIDLHLRVPETPMPCYFDRDKVEKILVNLISNAFKFTGEDGRILVTLKGDGSRAELRVTDTGVGIPVDQLPHLFDRFYHTTQSDMQAGSGLGLALTKDLVELHGGTIAVDSKEGKGTSFIVGLQTGADFFKPEEIVLKSPAPIATPSPSESGPAPVSAGVKKPIAEAFSPYEKPVILLVEDNTDVRAFIKEQLEGPYTILEAENGKVGLSTALEQMPDLVISDVMMPEMDGMEFCKLLKTNEKSSHIPVVMLTAKAEQSDKLEGLELGADDYLAKPFDARELQIRVSNLLTQRKKLQEHYRRTLTFATTAVEAESMDATFLRRVREAIEANLEDEGFSVVELGQQVGMSRSQLHRKLSALTGFSPNEVIRNMRLERAKQLLEKKAGTAAEIAFSCGFSSPAYFTKCFKEYFGVLPSEI